MSSLDDYLEANERNTITLAMEESNGIKQPPPNG